MSVFLLGFLFVVVIPLAEGVLLALLLRETHIHCPLPLGGAIVTSQWRRKSPVAAPTTNEVINTVVEEVIDGENTQETPNVQVAPPPDSATVSESTTVAPTGSPVNEEPPLAPPEPVSAEVNVFDGATNIPSNLPVSQVLDSMITAAPEEIPNDFEHRIEQSARSGTEIPSGVRHDPNDEMDADDLNALVAALPREKIDLTQELEMDSAVSENTISPIAKELLGKDFDFDTLESQSAKTVTFVNNESAEIPLDIQEDESGAFHVSSPFVFNVSPQLADFIVPQTIVSTFSDDWIQETGSVVESAEGDVSQFCFTEESRPMFRRKKKSS